MMKVSRYKIAIGILIALSASIFGTAQAEPTCDPNDVSGAYIMINLPESLKTFQNQVVLHNDHTAYFNTAGAVVRYVPTGMFEPFVGAWGCENDRVIVTLITYAGATSEGPKLLSKTQRVTMELSFDTSDLDHATLTRYAVVDIEPEVSINPLDPNVGDIRLNLTPNFVLERIHPSSADFNK